MTEIRVGQAYIAKWVKTGRSKAGDPYEMIIVQSPGRQQPRIAISVINIPSGLSASGVFKLTSIRSVQHRKWKDKNGVWKDGNVTVRARIKPLVQLGPKELEQLEYKEVTPQFKSLEDWFDE